MSTAEAREQAAAGWFTLAMGLVFGGAGIILAALAVAVDYTLKRDTKRNRGEWWRQSVADSEAWLQQDRQRRAEWRAARRQWWRDGADPATKPAAPSAAEGFGRWLRRRHATATVRANQAGGAWSRFRRGWLAGWSAADQVRRDGGGFRDITRARPEPKAADDAAPEGSDAGDNQPEGDASDGRTPAAIWMAALNDLMTKQPIGPEPSAEPTNHPPAKEPDDLKPNEGLRDLAQAPQAPTTTAGTGDSTMTAPAGETHTDLIVQEIGEIHTTLAQVTDLNDQLAAVRHRLEAQVQAVTERATANGATVETLQALDEARSVIEVIGQNIGNLADASVGAGDQAALAEAGMKPLIDAQDMIHSAGACGEIVAAANS